MPVLEYSQKDFQGIPPLNLVLPALSADLTANTANVGKVYLNTTSGRLRFHRTSAIIENLSLSTFIADADIASGAAISMAKLAVDPTARANHTGTQLASTISNLAAIVQAYRLDQFAAPTSPVAMGGQRLTGMADPTGSTDAATMQYVLTQITNAINGNDWKQSVRAASTANVAVASALINGLVMDGITLATGDRVLLKNQTTGAENGIYIVAAAGAASRASDADNTAPTNEVTAGMTVPVEGGGTLYGGTVWLLTTSGAITLGTTSIVFTQVGAAGATYTAGTGLTLTGNTFSITSPIPLSLGGTNATTAAAARTSLGVPRVGGVVAMAAALTAGSEAAFAHGFGVDGHVMVRDATTKAIVGIKVRTDSTNIYVTADIAVTSGALEALFVPSAS